MKSLFLYLFLFLLPLTFTGQTLTGDELLDKAIAYHDPNGNWARFNGSLKVTSQTPKGPARVSEMDINIPEEYFYIKTTRDTTTTEYTIEKEDCRIASNGKTNLSEAELKENRLSCRRANTFKDYYSYLYGLPMKLKDPGTNVVQQVNTQTFKGKRYLVLWVTYDVSVGTDVWTFYFDPYTHAMEVYQFHKGDPRRLGKDTGEYIILKDEVVIDGIKMPKTRAWFYNKDDKYLGTDTLENK
jgi:hypothetical protein